MGKDVSNTHKPLIIPREQHNLSRKAVSKNALKVLYHLNKHGFHAYLVGGSVRDILLGKIPKDFDIATDAHPEQIKKLFRNCLLIGRRFRIAHIRFSNEIIEVTTFRAQDNSANTQHRLVSSEGMLLRDNVYGSIHEDVWRRDFSINALYYNIEDFTLVDYCNGLQDIAEKRIRIIGEPALRFQEDPVRLLRAIRLAAKFEDFHFEASTEAALIQKTALLTQVSPHRLFEEVLKLFHSGVGVITYRLLKKFGLFTLLFPLCIDDVEDIDYTRWLETACANTDSRILARKTVSPGFLFCVILWVALQKEVKFFMKTSTSYAIAYQKAIKVVIERQNLTTSFTRFCSQLMRDVWSLQPALIQRHPKRIKRLLFHPRFRAAYDFLLLRAQCGEISPEISEWWTQLLNSSLSEKERLIQQLNPPRKNKS